MIHQLNPTILVDTPLGQGHALFLIDYGMHQNSCWVVALSDNGIVKHFDANDVVVATNYTYGMNLRHYHPQMAGSKRQPAEEEKDSQKDSEVPAARPAAT